MELQTLVDQLPDGPFALDRRFLQRPVALFAQGEGETARGRVKWVLTHQDVRASSHPCARTGAPSLLWNASQAIGLRLIGSSL